MKPDIVLLLAAAAVTASANGSGIDVKGYEGEAFLVLDSSATGASDNTYNLTLEESDDDVTYTAVAGVAFSQVTNAEASFQVVGVQTDGLKRYVRAVDTLAGTAPTVTRSLSLVGWKKY